MFVFVWSEKKKKKNFEEEEEEQRKNTKSFCLCDIIFANRHKGKEKRTNEKNAAIGGATAQVYTATANGNYAVVLTENGCTDTSACVNVVISSIGSMNMQEVVKVYPNPTSGLLNIDFGATQYEATVQIYDARGVAVQRFEISNTAVGQVQLPTVSGMYMIVVRTAEGMARFSVVRE